MLCDFFFMFSHFKFNKKRQKNHADPRKTLCFLTPTTHQRITNDTNDRGTQASQARDYVSTFVPQKAVRHSLYDKC